LQQQERKETTKERENNHPYNPYGYIWITKNIDEER
jgi:hypothetical protein